MKIVTHVLAQTVIGLETRSQENPPQAGALRFLPGGFFLVAWASRRGRDPERVELTAVKRETKP